MIIGNLNISPLAFYNDISLQNHRKNYAYGQIYPLITHANMLLPFQVVLDSANKTISQVKLQSLDTDTYTDITASIKEVGLTIEQFDNYNLLIYPAILPFTQTLLEGRYYLAIELNTGTIYSEVFTVVNDVSRYLLVEYRSTKDFNLPIGHVDFSNAFKFKCYIASQIGKPEYSFEEEATERLGYSFIESQISKKVYKFTFVAPEYLCDALRLIRLCDNKTIKEGRAFYDLNTFAMEPKWEDQGDLAAVECEFETDTVIANIGGFVPKKLGGDFNNDYNEDFDNK